MRNLKSYLSLLLMGAMSMTAFTGCQDDFDNPAEQVPASGWLAHEDNFDVYTINQLKTQYWSDADNYYQTVGTGEGGKHILVKGRVISSDASGNIYKSLVIQDETGALAMSINQTSMCVKYRRGQELVLDVTGMTIGKYASLQQLGAPEDSETYGPQTTFMAYEVFEEHAQMNGLPDPAAIDTTTVRSMAELSTTPEGLRQWQSRMVRFNNVEFVNGGKETFALSKETVNQSLTLEDGNSIIVRTSGYSNFYADVLPEGRGDVAGILSYHTSGGWQLLLIDRQGCFNFGNPTIGPGGQDNPYTVDDAISIMAGGGSATQVWTAGYIVGAVAPGVTSVTKNEDIQFTSTPELDNTLVIASSKDCKDYSQCIVFNLPQGSSLRKYGNLVDNPTNYGKMISVKGNLATVLDTWGITGNQGTSAEFSIEGVDVPADPGAELGDGSKEKPYTVTQVKGLGNPGTTAWVVGYIVGWVEGAKLEEGAHFSVPASSASNVLIAATPGETDPTKCVPVQLVSGTDLRKAVNLMDNAGNLGKVLKIEGTLVAYFGSTGIKEPTAWDLSGEGTTPVTPPSGDGDGTKTNPYTVSQGIALGNPGTTSWVTGYIVGWVDGAKLAEGSKFTVPATSASNVLIADSPTETDYNKCMPVQLVSGTDIRKAVNLMDNAGNLGKKLSIEGELIAYFGVPGIKSPTDYSLDGSGTTPVNPPSGDGDGTKEKPYTMTQIMALGNPGTTSWAKGYIVGWVPAAKIAEATFTVPATTYSNVLLAASPTETDYNKCVPLQLVANTDIRTAVNLADNPGNLGKELLVEGQLVAYFGVPGIKTPSAYELGGAGTTPDVPDVPQGDAGTESNPYTCAQTIALGSPGTEAWVEGYIVGVVEGAAIASGAKFEAATVYSNLLIADSATEKDYTKCIPVQLVANTAIRTELNLGDNAANLGKKVAISGKLDKYFGQAGLKSPTAYKWK